MYDPPPTLMHGQMIYIYGFTDIDDPGTSTYWIWSTSCNWWTPRWTFPSTGSLDLPSERHWWAEDCYANKLFLTKRWRRQIIFLGGKNCEKKVWDKDSSVSTKRWGRQVGWGRELSSYVAKPHLRWDVDQSSSILNTNHIERDYLRCGVKQTIFLASQDALEVMLFTYSLTDWLTDWWLALTWLMWPWWVMIPKEDLIYVTLVSDDT